VGALCRFEVVDWYRTGLRGIPGNIGCWLRSRLYGFHAGQRVAVGTHVIIHYPHRLTIGSNVGIASFSQLNAAGGIAIGSNVLLGPQVVVWSQNHLYEDASVPICEQGYQQLRVEIEDDVWVGAGAIILPGIRLGRGTVVAAGSVVIRSTEPYTVVAGVPARVVKRRSFPAAPEGCGGSSPPPAVEPSLPRFGAGLRAPEGSRPGR
jgi:maltose O-acetyltransferase